MSDSRQRRARYRAEALLATGLCRILERLPRRLASRLCGLFAAGVGPYAKNSRRAHHNLARALPDLTPLQHRRIVRDCWENIGRIVGEMPHIHRMTCALADTPEAAQADIIVHGAPYLQQDTIRQVLFVSAHLANWEILAHTASQINQPFVRVYRAPNNPYVDTLLTKLRQKVPGGLAPKSRDGSRILLKALKEGQSLGFLIDQRLKEGKIVPFFSMPALTTDAPVELARKYGLPLVPVRCERVNNSSRFRVTITKPLHIATHADTADILLQLNQQLEHWVGDTPGQWLWLHDRWRL